MTSGITFPVAGSASPTPVYATPESPTSSNPAVYTQDLNGAWHQQAGIDTTTSTSAAGGPLPPAGILTWFRRMFFRDNQQSAQTFKNSFLSVNHYLGSGTSQQNQDRALSLNMTNLTNTVGNFSITNNVIKFGIGSTPQRWIPGQQLRVAGLSTTVGLLMNGVDLFVQQNDAVNSFLYCTGFSHADVFTTTDPGQIDQPLWSMAGLQSEVDVVGTPPQLGSPDGELTAVSAQLGYTGTGTMLVPNQGLCSFRGTTSRASSGKVTGAALGFFGLNQYVVNTNHSDPGPAGFVGACFSVSDMSGGSATTAEGFGVIVQTPGPNRFGNLNRGVQVGDYGTNAADWAIYVLGSKDSSACLFQGPVVLGGGHGVIRTARANGTAPGNVDAAGVLVFTAVTSVSYTFTETYSAAPVVIITPVVPAGTTFELSALSTSGFTVTANQTFTGHVNYITVGRN